ncbi:MAG: helix-hairpin-helix domain-containing protein [Polyangiaceae bacterium]|nr:helix-hairpin-helix domain-containing protein [Polyangiaceae bacterium]
MTTPASAPADEVASPAARRRPTLARGALRWLGGAALVAGLAGLGAWSAPSHSASAGPPPRPEPVAVTVGASATPAPPSSSSSSSSSTPERPASPVAGVLPDGRVVLNAASEEELTKLPSVGPSRAKAIVALRTRLGRFRQLSELLRVKGIGRKTLAKISAKAVLDAPPG